MAAVCVCVQVWMGSRDDVCCWVECGRGRAAIALGVIFALDRASWNLEGGIEVPQLRCCRSRTGGRRCGTGRRTARSEGKFVMPVCDGTGRVGGKVGEVPEMCRYFAMTVLYAQC